MSVEQTPKKDMVAITPETPATPSKADARDQFYDLIYWRNPRNTGIVAGLGLAFGSAVYFTELTVVGVMIRLALFSLVVAYAWTHGRLIFAAFARHKLTLQVPPPDSEPVFTRDSIEPIVDGLLKYSNKIAVRLRKVFYCTDIYEVVSAVAILYLLLGLFSIFSMSTVSYFGFLLLFILPRALESHQKSVSDNLNNLKSQVHSLITLTLASIPKASDLEVSDKKKSN